MPDRTATAVEVADGCHAYLQADGSWGWSNAGLIVGDGTSLLVDTLFDLVCTQRMLARFAEHTQVAPINTVVNTHANGDHCFGNQLVTHAQIVSSRATRDEMAHVPPALLDGLVKDPGPIGDVFRSFFGEFVFEDVPLRLPDRTFDGRLEMEIGGRHVELIEVGPAHTDGDTLVHVPDAKVIYAGDILFIGGTPVVWAGPLQNWVDACDLMLGMDIETVVPGHGPVTDKAGVAAVRDYLVWVNGEATARYDAGMDAFDAARDIASAIGAREEFSRLGEFGRITVNVEAVYRTLDPTHETPPVPEQFRRMFAIERLLPGR
jgi:cyclase